MNEIKPGQEQLEQPERKKIEDPVEFFKVANETVNDFVKQQLTVLNGNLYLLENAGLAQNRIDALKGSVADTNKLVNQLYNIDLEKLPIRTSGDLAFIDLEQEQSGAPAQNKQLSQMSLAEALRLYQATISHYLNNQIQIALSNNELLLINSPDNEQLKANQQAIERLTNFVKKITQLEPEQIYAINNFGPYLLDLKSDDKGEKT